MRGRPRKVVTEELKYCMCLNTCYMLGENKVNAHYCCHYCPARNKCAHKCIENPTKCKLFCESKEELESFTTLPKKEEMVKEIKKEEKVVTVEFKPTEKRKRGRPRKNK